MDESTTTEFQPGEHYYDSARWDQRAPEGPHIWRTLGYERIVWEPGRQVVRWRTTEDYAFPSRSGHIIHGGMVATLLDTAMGGAAWTLLNNDEAFLTADLRVEFLRATRPGVLRADGRVIRKARRVIFCAGDLYDESDKLMATGRCTQILLSADSPAGRP